MEKLSRIKKSILCKLYGIIWREQFILILLIILVWPVGVYQMWKQSRWNDIVKCIITLFCIIITIIKLQNLN
ncbi:hypothetical protein SAMN05421842_11588 [Clostridium uliginosum]|uniref:Uncharacterized protein n=1 Tax=Clostridium uliginosum TaxID=119641 RepID=A0A1I1NJR5_9CLOT|nr:hypothetical protein SAMN05421842_11588 [Clostridium uliginosum]